VSDFERQILLAYFVAFFLFAFVLRSVLVWRRTGINPLVLPRGDDAHGYVARAFKLMIVACAVVVGIVTSADAAPRWLGAWPLLESSLASTCGWLLLAVALAWVLVAQAQMGASWRIGIDSEHATALVQNGLFGVSRNPIFLAMRVDLLALLLIFPAAATAALLVAGEVLIQLQVRLEEQHLRALHGQAYADYCARVRRWL
jgi:protein-S-isoprenylcysteine O-methyltransferase Ste14